VELFINILAVIGGTTLLFLGGEGVVRGAVTLAERLNLSRLLISTVIIGFGTSAPELVVSLDAALAGLPEIAIANVVGSNLSNTLLVLGIAAMLANIPCSAPQIRRDALMGVAASTILGLLALLGSINRLSGLLMLMLLGFYLGRNIWREKQTQKPITLPENKPIEALQKELNITPPSLPATLPEYVTKIN
jgi:cation:H+ antiporter